MAWRQQQHRSSNAMNIISVSKRRNGGVMAAKHGISQYHRLAAASSIKRHRK